MLNDTMPEWRQWNPMDDPATFGEQLKASASSVFETNYATQLYHTMKLYNLRSEIPGPNDAWTWGGLSPDDPGGRVMSVDEANEKGKDLGLRFSEPQTEAQFQYMSGIKQAEVECEHIFLRTHRSSEARFVEDALFFTVVAIISVVALNATVHHIINTLKQRRADKQKQIEAELRKYL